MMGRRMKSEKKGSDMETMTTKLRAGGKTIFPPFCFSQDFAKNPRLFGERKKGYTTFVLITEKEKSFFLVIRKENGMKTRFLWKDMEADEAAKTYILKRLGEVSDLFSRVSLYEIETGRDKRGFFRVEVNVKEPKELYRGEEISKSIEGSIDMVIEKLRSQVTRTKDRERDMAERGARSIKKKTVLDKSARF